MGIKIKSEKSDWTFIIEPNFVIDIMDYTLIKNV